MSDMRVQIVLATFEDEESASAALEQLKGARKAAKLDFDDSAVIRKDPDGTLHIKESDDLSAAQGAGRGALIGGVIGLLAGPAGVVVGAGAGALVGSIFDRRDDGFQDEALEALGATLSANSSALVAVVPEVWIPQFQAELSNHSQDVSVTVLDDDTAARLQANASIADVNDVDHDAENDTEGNGGE